MSEFERQAAARELLGGELVRVKHVPQKAETIADSIFQMSAGSSGTATPSVGVQQTVQSNSMSAPPPKQISAATPPQYEVEEVEEDLVTARR